MKRKTLFDAAGIQRTLGRLALEIAERLHGCKGVVLIGIHRRGVPLAKRIAAKLEEVEKVKVPVGTLDINLYRDDFSSAGAAPVLRGTQVDFDIEGRRWSWWTTSSSRGAPSAPPSTPSWTWGARAGPAGRRSWTGGTGSCRSRRTTWGSRSTPGARTTWSST